MKNIFLLVLTLLIAADGFGQCGADSTQVSIFITTDAWGYENYWEIVPSTNGCGNGTLYSGGNELVGCEGTAADGGYPSNTLIEVPSFCLPTGQVIDFIFVDSYGDGGAAFEVYENGSFSNAFYGAGFGNTWTVDIGNSGLPAYDSPCGALEVIPNGEGVLIDNTLCIAQAAEPVPVGGNCGIPGFWCEGDITNTAWAFFVAEPNVTYEITTCNDGEGFDTQLALFKADACLGWSSFELVAANDDMAGGCAVSDGYSSRMYASCLDAGATYYVQLDGWEGEVGVAQITVSTVNVSNELQAVFNNIRCPLIKGEIPQSSILPYFSGSGSNFECAWTGPNGFTSAEQSIYEVGPGEYSLLATDACGNNYNASFTVTLPDLWLVNTEITGTTCRATSDGSIDLSVNGASAPYTYEWEGPNGFTSDTQDVQALASGNYQITVTDNNGCENTAFLLLQPENSFNFSLGNDTSLCLNDDLLVFGPSGLFYQWQDLSTNQFFTLEADEWGLGQHALVLTATTPEGCIYADDLVVTVLECTSNSPELDGEQVRVYPNPTDGLLNMEFNSVHAALHLRLLDASGRVVAMMNASQQSRIQWNPVVAPGIYQLHVTSDTSEYITRCVIQ